MKCYYCKTKLKAGQGVKIDRPAHITCFKCLKKWEKGILRTRR